MSAGQPNCYHYRQGVVVVVFLGNKPILFYRTDHPNSGQFVQGGVEVGEDPIHAAYRELKEEIGLDGVPIFPCLPSFNEITAYNYPEGMIIGNQVGQAHTWFYCSVESCALFKLGDEFSSYEVFNNWDQLAEYIVPFKRAAYFTGYWNVLTSKELRDE